MRLLAVTNIYPTRQRPALGTFVEQQLTSLSHLGIDVDVLFVDRAHLGMQSYMGLGRRVRGHVTTTQPDLVHIMYGGVMAAVVTRAITDRPMVVSFCGSKPAPIPADAVSDRSIFQYWNQGPNDQAFFS